MNIPAKLKYTKDHEWAEISGKSLTVGITDHAQGSLGDIVYVDLPKVGRTLKKGETFGVVESIKAVSDLYSPVTGTVIEVNDPLKGEPSQINQDPYAKSWMIKLEVQNPQELNELLDSSSYEAYVKSL